MSPVRHPIRLLVAFGLTVALSAVPISRVAACSCGGGALPDAIRGATIALIGTVNRTADAAPDELGPRVRYEFAVERANRQTGPTVEIVAWAGGGGSCGVTFGRGERWLILAHSMEGSLQTNLCSSNMLVDDVPPADRASLPELMPFEPTEAHEPEPGESPNLLADALPLILIGGIVVAAAVGTAAWLLGRRWPEEG